MKIFKAPKIKQYERVKGKNVVKGPKTKKIKDVADHITMPLRGL